MEEVYSGKDIRRAVNLAALLGWMAVTTPYLLQVPAVLPFAALIGMPLAFAASWLISAPILRRVMRRSVSWIRAGIWGGAIAMLIASVYVGFIVIMGWLQSRDPNSWSQIGGGERIQSIDGILTLFGWWIIVQNTVLFALSGVAIALILRWLIGPGQPEPGNVSNRKGD